MQFPPLDAVFDILAFSSEFPRRLPYGQFGHILYYGQPHGMVLLARECFQAQGELIEASSVRYEE